MGSVELLALGPASRLIGVDPDTLRRWADDGRVEVSITPGGHRRFHRRSLERLLRAGSDERPTLARLGGTPQRLTAAYRRTYRTIGPPGVTPVASSSRPSYGISMPPSRASGPQRSRRPRAARKPREPGSPTRAAA
jgi:hypothetical protein